MKTKEEQILGKSVYKSRQGEAGNALVYVLIAIALFAALSFALSRQSGTEEAGDLAEERAQFFATQVMSYAAQAQSAVDQMLFIGAEIDDLDFVLPGEQAFEDGDDLNKVFHPQGGGLNQGVLAPRMIQSRPRDNPQPGWYMGRFNTVEWTPSERFDVILTAYQVSRLICEHINEVAIGTREIPVMRDSIRETLIDGRFSGGANVDLTTGTGGRCEACANQSSMCVQNSDQSAYAFYTIIAAQ